MNGPHFSVGVDVGGTNIKFGIVDESGAILVRRKADTEAERGSDVIAESIVTGIRAMLLDASLRHKDLTSIGLGVPGTADSATGTVVYAPNLFWRNVPIVAAIQPSFAAPIAIAQDTRAAAWAEYLVGSARGVQNLAAVTLGTGIGCGMVIGGRIFHGGLNTAGEFGHQIVELDGDACNCGRRGCLEAYAGGLAIVRRAKERIPDLPKLLGKSESAVTVSDVYDLAGQGNQEARQIADEVMRYIGIGLVNLINLTSVEAICISGGISNAPPALLIDPLVEFVRRRAYQEIAGKVQICRSALGEDAPLIGAALLDRAASKRTASA
ncbi:MAG: ROK family protein [Acidobacteriaceae bacterium]